MRHTAQMLRWIARGLLFKVLPRRILPIVTLVELALLVRGVRKRHQPVNEPTDSRTAPPPPLPGSVPEP